MMLLPFSFIKAQLITIRNIDAELNIGPDDQSLISCMDRSDVRSSDEYELAKVPLKGSVDCEISDCFKCLPEKVCCYAHKVK